MQSKIYPSVRSFFHNILDYAGLFPPASLNLQDSFNNYLDYMQCNENWMLSKFICPIKKAPELRSILPSGISDEKIRLSLIASPYESSDEFLIHFADDMMRTANLDDRFHNTCSIETIELKFPDDLFSKNPKIGIKDFIDNISAIVKTNFEHRIFIFCEIPASEEIEKNMKQAIPAINIHNEQFNDAGYKLRTGGTTAAEIPSANTIVSAIRECLDCKVIMKFTAGMHHPFRHYDELLESNMHGFINVFGAGILAFRHTISDHELRELIEDEQKDNFIFNEDSFEWKGWKSDTEEIHGARNGLVVSFGSCSFAEPTDDLKELRLLY